jgi:hypothetical protein
MDSRYNDSTILPDTPHLSLPSLKKPARFHPYDRKHPEDDSTNDLFGEIPTLFPPNPTSTTTTTTTDADDADDDDISASAAAAADAVGFTESVPDDDEILADFIHDDSLQGPTPPSSPLASFDDDPLDDDFVLFP